MHIGVHVKTSSFCNNYDRLIFVKLAELHIAAARNTLMHQNQPIAQYLLGNQSYML